MKKPKYKLFISLSLFKHQSYNSEKNYSRNKRCCIIFDNFKKCQGVLQINLLLFRFLFKNVCFWEVIFKPSLILVNVEFLNKFFI